MIVIALFGLVMAAVTRQLVESGALALKSARLIEYSRNARNVIERMSSDVRTAQSIVIYPEFNDRTAPVAIGSYGNYLVLHMLNSSGAITRTIGYYAVADSAAGTLTLYRHDSADGGGLTPGNLPVASTSGTHRRVVRTLKIPSGSGVKLFNNWDGFGVTLRGQFGAVDGQGTSRLDYIQCRLATRS